MSKPILAAMLSCKTTVLTDAEKRLFEKYNPLGITLFSRNLENERQAEKLINDIKNSIARDDVLIAVDAEGGRVSRLKFMNEYVSALELAKNPKEYTQMHASLISSDMLTLGMNVNFAPVIDVDTPHQTKALKDRCFSSNHNSIVEYATIMADTYIDMGICPCIKHIPGHFGTKDDPHLSITKTPLSKKDIEQEITYIKELTNYPMAMASHIMLEAIDDKNPLTTSQKAISEIIRGYLGYDGFLFSDAIDMRALKGNITERLENSLNAGIDCVCYCSGIYDDLEAICKKQRFLTEKTLIRFAKIKNIIHNTPKQIDIKYIRDKYNNYFRDKFGVQYTYDATEVFKEMLKKGD